MSRTWREWGVERQERSLRKEHTDWKNEALEELTMASEGDVVYVIINEWEANDEDSLLEIVGGAYFSTEESAWDRLDEIADVYGVELNLEDTSFEVPSDNTYETYYIMELRKYDEGA